MLVCVLIAAATSVAEEAKAEAGIGVEAEVGGVCGRDCAVGVSHVSLMRGYDPSLTWPKPFL